MTRCKTHEKVTVQAWLITTFKLILSSLLTSLQILWLKIHIKCIFIFIPISIDKYSFVHNLYTFLQAISPIYLFLYMLPTEFHPMPTKILFTHDHTDAQQKLQKHDMIIAHLTQQIPPHKTRSLHPSTLRTVHKFIFPSSYILISFLPVRRTCLLVLRPGVQLKDLFKIHQKVEVNHVDWSFL